MYFSTMNDLDVWMTLLA